MCVIDPENCRQTDATADVGVFCVIDPENCGQTGATAGVGVCLCYRS